MQLYSKLLPLPPACKNKTYRKKPCFAIVAFPFTKTMGKNTKSFDSDCTDDNFLHFFLNNLTVCDSMQPFAVSAISVLFCKLPLSHSQSKMCQSQRWQMAVWCLTPSSTQSAISVSFAFLSTGCVRSRLVRHHHGMQIQTSGITLLIYHSKALLFV